MLKIVNLNVFYGKVHVLHGVTLDAKAGELVTLIGGNGVGKSTTLKTISGLLQPRSGKIWFDKELISGIAPHNIVKKGIIQVPEGRRVFPEMTVKENLRMGGFARKRTDSLEEDYELVFKLFPVLKERIKQIAGTLSGGEQQMLAMGRGLMGKPRLLLLDEPSMGLAPVLVEAVFEKIIEIKAQGITIVLVEQNAHMALKVADRVFVMETGSIVVSGPAAELKDTQHIKDAYLGAV